MISLKDEEINKLVAEKVFELNVISETSYRDFLKEEHLIKNYSSEIGTAFEVVEWLNIKGLGVELFQQRGGKGFVDPQKECTVFDTGEKVFTVWSDDLSRSICLAALKVAGVEI